MNHDNDCKPVSLPNKQPCKMACPQQNECFMIADECAEINVPIELRPKVEIGKILTECCGEPSVKCECDPCSGLCNIMITQKIKIKIPVEYNIDTIAGDSFIECDPCCICKR